MEFPGAVWRTCRQPAIGGFVLGICAGVAMLAGCGALQQAQDDKAAWNDMQPPLVSKGTSSNHHLYVADPGSGAIYRYALVNGLPQTSPDEVFAKLPSVAFLGVDRNGDIYAGGTASGGGFVQEFSPSGALLGKAQLNIPVAAFAVDLDGYMYVSPRTTGNQAFTYAPKSLHRRGTAKPIATLTAQGSNGANEFASLAADAKGRLYAAAFGGMNVYNHPRRSSSQSLTIAVPKRGWHPYFVGALAFSERSRVYANIQYLDYCGGGIRRCHTVWWHLTDFDAISQLGGRREDRWILAQNCYTYSTAPPGKISGNVTGMAVFGGYIEAACTNDYASDTSVWVYRAEDFGQHQHAVEILSGLTAPSDAKIGP
jgi:hypothetical protein